MTKVEADVTGNVWKIEVEVGAQVDRGDVIMILESMKMEIPVEAMGDGTVLEIRVQEGQSVREGDTVAVLG
jgi:acetyl-CoA carboxylase biotin carboxyl carrier protein